MPEEIVSQQKQYWAGSIGARSSEKVLAHMAAVVDNSDYDWIRQFRFPTVPRQGLPFRQYGLVTWLQAHYKERLEADEVRELSRRVQEVNVTERKKASYLQRKEFVTRYCPRLLLRMVRRIIHKRMAISAASQSKV
jgi:hypothetical protein